MKKSDYAALALPAVANKILNEDGLLWQDRIDAIASQSFDIGERMEQEEMERGKKRP